MQIIVTDELYHHGILGMHWGIRRFQNKDGSLTAEGIKRYRTDLKFKAKYDKYTAKKEAKNKEKADKAEAERINKIKSKSVKDLTDDEIRERIARLELEKRMIDLERAVNGATQSGGQQSRDDKNTNAVVKFGKDAAGQFLKTTTSLATSYLAKKMMKSVFKDFDDGDKKKNNSDNNDDSKTKDKKDKNESKRSKKNTVNDAVSDTMDDVASSFKDAADSFKETFRDAFSTKKDSGTSEKSASYDYDVFGKGTSNYDGWKSSYDFVDVDYSDAASSSTASYGKSYVDNLLGTNAIVPYDYYRR